MEIVWIRSEASENSRNTQNDPIWFTVYFSQKNHLEFESTWLTIRMINSRLTGDPSISNYLFFRNRTHIHWILHNKRNSYWLSLSSVVCYDRCSMMSNNQWSSFNCVLFNRSLTSNHRIRVLIIHFFSFRIAVQTSSRSQPSDESTTNDNWQH